MEEIEETNFEETNVWLARKLSREQFKFRLAFMRAISSVGSFDFDWDVINEKSFGKKVAAQMKKQAEESVWHC